MSAMMSPLVFLYPIETIATIATIATIETIEVIEAIAIIETIVTGRHGRCWALIIDFFLGLWDGVCDF